MIVLAIYPVIKSGLTQNNHIIILVPSKSLETFCFIQRDNFDFVPYKD